MSAFACVAPFVLGTGLGGVAIPTTQVGLCQARLDCWAHSSGLRTSSAWRKAHFSSRGIGERCVSFPFAALAAFFSGQVPKVVGA